MSANSASAAATQPGFIRAPLEPFIQNIPFEIGYKILSFAMLNDFDNSLPLVSRTWHAMYKDSHKFKKFLEHYFKGEEGKYRTNQKVLRMNRTLEKNMLMGRGYHTKFYSYGSPLVKVRFKSDDHVSAIDIHGTELIWKVGQTSISPKRTWPERRSVSTHSPLLKEKWTLQINSIHLVIFNKKNKAWLQIKHGDRFLKDESHPGAFFGTPVFYKGILACIFLRPEVIKCHGVLIFDFVNQQKTSNTNCSFL